MKYIVIDLEMNPLPQKFKKERKICKNEIIQIGAVCLNENLQEVNHFMTYVHPGFSNEISVFIQDLTHITTGMVQGAPRFPQAIQMFFQWCYCLDDELHFLQWSDTDYLQICKEMKLNRYIVRDIEKNFMDTEWTDLQVKFGERLGKERLTSLSEALMLMGMDFKGHQHNALTDARNEAEVWRILHDPKECDAKLGIAMEAMQDTPLAFTIADAIDLNSLELTA